MKKFISIMASLLLVLGISLASTAPASAITSQKIIVSGASFDGVRLYNKNNGCCVGFAYIQPGNSYTVPTNDTTRVIVSRDYKIGVVNSDGSYTYGGCNPGPYNYSNPNDSKATQVYKVYRSTNDTCVI